ncbi:AAA family ATPase [Dokdonia sp.]|uniref:AAA family ATPase n=1 Tax=Dokdonia sp. TaxID=2024995 RepID=UPI00326391B2
MIKTIKVKEPAFFKSNDVKEFKSLLIKHFSQPISRRSQKKFPISDIELKLKNVKSELLKKTANKCAYCESEFKDSFVTIDHFRPHHAAADIDGKISSEHYWWLAFNWNNLYPVCQVCNSNKKNYFPISKQRATVKYYGKGTLFNKENPIFIDPEYENPEEYFYYDQNGIIYTKTERGRITIDLLGLNRTELVEARKVVVFELDYLFEDLLKAQKGYNPDGTFFNSSEMQNIFERLEESFNTNEIPYLGMRRYFIRQYFWERNIINSPKNFLPTSFRRKLKITLKQEHSFNDIPRTVINQFEINTISIKNYKSINEITIDFKRTKNGNAGWAILIGENGVGKSSTLSATLKTLIGRNYSGFKFNKHEIKRDQDENASVIISFNNNNLNADVLIADRILYFLPKDHFINSSILAFGPFKHSNKNDSYYKSFKGSCFVDNFFNPATPLHNALKFILRLTPEQFEYVAISLLDLLMLENRAKIYRKENTEEVWFQYNNSDRKQFFNQLSDGYQSIITLGCNIIEGLLLNNESIENASGFVVIDEIGANLHPRWKMQIVKRLRRTFPNVQFLATTHDPLCLKGIEENETYVLKSNNGELEVLTDLPNPSEYRADQLLTSEFFGLFSTVDPEMEEDFIEYYELLYKSSESLNISEKRRLDDLKKVLREKNHLGNSLREELLYVAIDEILSKQKQSKKPFSRIKVVKEVKEIAIELMDEFLNDLEE